MLKGLLLFVAALAAVVRGQFAPDTAYSSVTNDGGKAWTMVAGCNGNYAACATLDDGVWTTGWYTLNIDANPAASDAVQAFGAGYAEGALTAGQMWNSFATWVNGTSYSWPAPAVKNFALQQDAWVRQQANTQHTAYWNSVALVYKQWDGIVAGYSAYAPATQQLPYDQWLAFQLQDEIGDIMAALNLTDSADTMNPTMEHCSSLVKISNDGQRLFAAHDTWSEFESMLRIFKHIDFHFTAASGSTVGGASFSSFPGAIPSIDDYYVTDAQLTVMETTNGVMNNTLYNLWTTTSTVPYFVRVTVANRMASSGEEWMNAFGQFNSGTYNNQWIIVDNKRFTPGQTTVQPGTLWIGEQIPGYFITQDMSESLQQPHGYWASYNIPYFPFVWNISGYLPFFEKYGNTYSHDHCARANIFRRDAPAVNTMEDMKAMMRYNEWQTDPLSLQDSCRGISARCDLNSPWANNNPLNPYSAFGAIDSKITSDQLSSSRTTLAVSGPTWDSQPVFAWTKQWAYVPHYGQPDVFNFDFISQSPQQPKPDA